MRGAGTVGVIEVCRRAGLAESVAAMNDVAAEGVASLADALQEIA